MSMLGLERKDMLTWSLLANVCLLSIPVVQFGTDLPNQDWQIREDAQRDIYDAVVIKDVIALKNHAIYRYLKLRILSEKGKAAVDFFAPKGEFLDFKGRVLNKDGGEVVFDNKQDFVKLLSYQGRTKRKMQRVLVPPGLTRDAIVEYSWLVKAQNGLQMGTREQIYYVQSPFYVLEKRFQYPSDLFEHQDQPFPIAFRATAIKKPALLELKTKKGMSYATYRHVPPLFEHPLGNVLLDENSAHVAVFKTFSNYPADTEAFWKKFSREWVRDFYSVRLKKTPAYKAWVRQISDTLPQDPPAALAAAYNAFRRKVRTPHLMTPSQLASVDHKNGAFKSSLELAVSEGYVGFENVGKVFFQLTKDLGIQADLIFANSFEESQFLPQHKRPLSLPIGAPFFGVRQKNGWFMVSPLNMEYEPGYVPPKFQGSKGLVVSPHNKWRHTFTSLDRLGPENHQRVTDYQTTLTENGETHVVIARRLSGQFKAKEKRHYFMVSPKERLGLMKKHWQDRFADLEVTNVEAQGVESLIKDMRFSLKAKGIMKLRELPFYVVQPFPGQVWPIHLPDHWPRHRRQPILLAHCFTQIDTNQISPPEHWTLNTDPSWRKENSVGKVVFSGIQKDGSVWLRREIILKSDILQPEEESQFKAFLAWVNEAMNQTIGFVENKRLK